MLLVGAVAVHRDNYGVHSDVNALKRDVNNVRDAAQLVRQNGPVVWTGLKGEQVSTCAYGRRIPQMSSLHTMMQYIQNCGIARPLITNMRSGRPYATESPKACVAVTIATHLHKFKTMMECTGFAYIAFFADPNKWLRENTSIDISGHVNGVSYAMLEDL